jgi:hypothetical protein
VGKNKHNSFKENNTECSWTKWGHRRREYEFLEEQLNLWRGVILIRWLKQGLLTVAFVTLFIMSFVSPVNLYFIWRISCPNIQGSAMFAIWHKFFPRTSNCYLLFNNDNSLNNNKNNVKCIFPATCHHIERPAPAPIDLTVVHAQWPESRTNQNNQEVFSTSAKAQIYGKGTKKLKLRSRINLQQLVFWRILSPFRFRIFFFTPSPTTRSTK